MGLDSDFFNMHIVPDNGLAFFSYLNQTGDAKRFAIKRSKSSKWFLEFSNTLEWADIAGRVTRPVPTSDPGPFLGELHTFGFKDQGQSIEAVAQGVRDYANKVKAMSGIYVYRDNFRIRLGADWLRLGESQTSGGSWYGLRPKNTIGFFAVSSRDNPGLVEKSDREGFIDNAARVGFLEIAEKVKDFANDSLEAMRRRYNEFKKTKRTEDQNPALVVSAKEGARQIAQLMQVSSEVGENIRRNEAAHARSLQKARVELKEAMASKALPADLRKQFSSALDDIDKVISQATDGNREVQKVLSEFVDMQKHIAVIEDRFEQLEGQISEVYETVGIGLAAQALAHEIHPAIDEISSCIRGLNARLKNAGKQDAKVVGDLEYIRSHAVMIGKKLSFIDPMLRTFREQKHDIMLSKFLRDFFALRKERLEKFNILTYVEVRKEHDLRLRINKGRLSQIIDNLTRNSEYWLRRASLQGHKGPFEVHAEISQTRLTFWDNGFGIRPAMEEVCFDLFVSDKPKGEGHGLGLFITSQLLEEEDCHIFLSDERNDRGRRFKFVVDFGGVLKGAD
jgi:signal transduction histidine kinase